MKLIIAIVSDEDGNSVLRALNEEGFGVTKLATTGGFLKQGNMTLLIGTEEDRLNEAIGILKDKCHTRKKVTTASMISGITGMIDPYPIEVEMGGVTIFVVDVDRFEKV